MPKRKRTTAQPLTERSANIKPPAPIDAKRAKVAIEAAAQVKRELIGSSEYLETHAGSLARPGERDLLPNVQSSPGFEAKRAVVLENLQALRDRGILKARIPAFSARERAQRSSSSSSSSSSTAGSDAFDGSEENEWGENLQALRDRDRLKERIAAFSAREKAQRSSSSSKSVSDQHVSTDNRQKQQVSRAAPKSAMGFDGPIEHSWAAQVGTPADRVPRPIRQAASSATKKAQQSSSSSKPILDQHVSTANRQQLQKVNATCNTAAPPNLMQLWGDSAFTFTVRAPDFINNHRLGPGYSWFLQWYHRAPPDARNKIASTECATYPGLAEGLAKGSPCPYWVKVRG